MTGEEHAARVRPFLSKFERSRLDDLSPGSKKRIKLLNRLAHGYERVLDWRLASGTGGDGPAIAELMIAEGAAPTCYAACRSSRETRPRAFRPFWRSTASTQSRY